MQNTSIPSDASGSPQALLNILHELGPADLARLATVSRALWAFAGHDELVRAA